MFFSFFFFYLRSVLFPLKFGWVGDSWCKTYFPFWLFFSICRSLSFFFLCYSFFSNATPLRFQWYSFFVSPSFAIHMVFLFRIPIFFFRMLCLSYSYYIPFFLFSSYFPMMFLFFLYSIPFLSILFLFFLSYSFFLWYSYDIPMPFLFSYAIHMVFLWYSYDIPFFSYADSIFPMLFLFFLCYSYFPMLFLWYSNDIPMIFIFSNAFPMIFLWY